MRDAGFRVSWFSSATPHRIPHPPSLPAHSGVHVDDLYIHWYGTHVEDGTSVKFQVWVCDGTDPAVWTSIKPGYKRLLAKQQVARFFIMTSRSKKPSWALAHTVSRLYPHLAGDLDGTVSTDEDC